MPASVQTRTTQSSGLMRTLRHHPGKNVKQRDHRGFVDEHEDVNIAPLPQKRRRIVRHDLHSKSPCNTVTACPESMTRSPTRRTPTSPPRAEAWNARNVVLPSFPAQ